MVRKLESLWKAGCLFYYNSISWASSSEKSDMELSDELSPVPSSCSFSASSVAYFWMYSACDRKEKTLKQHIFNRERMAKLGLTAGGVTRLVGRVGYRGYCGMTMFLWPKAELFSNTGWKHPKAVRDTHDPWKCAVSTLPHHWHTHTRSEKHPKFSLVEFLSHLL